MNSHKNRKIPVRILRYCKEQLYELVKSFNPEKKMSVVSMDEISTKDDIEFVVGVGVAEEQRRIAKVGYQAVEVKDFFLICCMRIKIMILSKL
jgi:hypothetical protein